MIMLHRPSPRIAHCSGSEAATAGLSTNALGQAGSRPVAGGNVLRVAMRLMSRDTGRAANSSGRRSGHIRAGQIQSRRGKSIARRRGVEANPLRGSNLLLTRYLPRVVVEPLGPSGLLQFVLQPKRRLLPRQHWRLIGKATPKRWHMIACIL
jgi:hypothetical protein